MHCLAILVYRRASMLWQRCTMQIQLLGSQAAALCIVSVRNVATLVMCDDVGLIWLCHSCQAEVKSVQCLKDVTLQRMNVAPEDY